MSSFCFEKTLGLNNLRSCPSSVYYEPIVCPRDFVSKALDTVVQRITASGIDGN